MQAEKLVSVQDPQIQGDLNVYAGAGLREQIPVHKPPRNLPPRQATFAGREVELRELHERLSGSREVGITQQTAVHGHGGIGKTSLAVEYGWTHLDDYPGGVFFLNCDSELPPPIAELAPHLGLESAETAEETAQRVKVQLETGGPSLLILDNVRGPAQWRSREWSRHLPGEACRRLVTTRAESLPGVKMYPLERLSSEDGVRLLAKYRDDVQENEPLAKAVVEWFDGLAVGLTVVGAYLAMQPRLSWRQYVDDLERKGLGAVRQTERAVGHLPDYEARVDAVFDELLDALPAEQRRALEYAALLPEDQVYALWVAELLEGDEDVEVPELPGYEQPGEAVVWALVDRQLLRARGEEKDVVGLHRVLRRRVWERLDEGGAMDRLVNQVAELAERRGKASHDAVIEATLRRELTPLIALSRELDTLGRTEVAASLANWISTPLRALGRFTEARALLEEFAHAERLEALPVEKVAALLSNLAMHLQDLGELAEARRRMERAIEIKEQHFDPDHLTLAVSYSNLAGILKDLGELVEARWRMEQAIEIDERHFDPDHPVLATSYSNLAMILKNLGEMTEARRLIERVIEIEEQHFDPDHPTLAISYSNLATVLWELRDLTEARRRMERAIEINERHFDSDHPVLATCYSNIAMILKALGDLAEARRQMERAIEIDERHFDPDHPTLAVSYHNLAWVELELGNQERACALLHRAKAILDKHFTPAHPHVKIVAAAIERACTEPPE
ncbi:MAG TPA: tetratricopeptide repeat protein [Longimicrobium sp.]|jgi:tetratricopeptide (TPR) repeat protein